MLRFDLPHATGQQSLAGWKPSLDSPLCWESTDFSAGDMAGAADASKPGEQQHQPSSSARDRSTSPAVRHSHGQGSANQPCHHGSDSRSPRQKLDTVLIKCLLRREKRGGRQRKPHLDARKPSPAARSCPWRAGMRGQGGLTNDGWRRMWSWSAQGGRCFFQNPCLAAMRR